MPGEPILGEGKAENQNHAIIFTRGDALQAVDMNQASLEEYLLYHFYIPVIIDFHNHFSISQDSYLEEALKMRNLLEEFHMDNGFGAPSILGMSEHIFSGR